MTFLIVGILVPALSFGIYALIHFWAEGHMAPGRTRNYSVVTIRSTRLPRQNPPAHNKLVTIGTRAMLSTGESLRRSY